MLIWLLRFIIGPSGDPTVLTLLLQLFLCGASKKIHISSVIQSCLTLCAPVVCSIPGLPVHHRLPEFTHTHTHRVSDAIQPSHRLSSPSPAFNLSQHQGQQHQQLTKYQSYEPKETLRFQTQYSKKKKEKNRT